MNDDIMHKDPNLDGFKKEVEENSSLVSSNEGEFDAQSFYHTGDVKKFETPQDKSEESIYKPKPTETPQEAYNEPAPQRVMEKKPEPIVEENPLMNAYKKVESVGIAENNPLNQYFRRPILSVALPTEGKYYPQGFLKTTVTGELEVFSMTVEDELLLNTPDSLVTGQALFRIIQSCVPGVTDATQLYTPDSNVLLLALRIATYGETSSYEFECPRCRQRYDDKLQEKDGDTKAQEMIDDKTVLLGEQKHKFSVQRLIDVVDIIKNTTINFEETDLQNLEIEIRPSLLKSAEISEQIEFEQNKILQAVKDETSKMTKEEREKLFEESLHSIQDNNRLFILSCVQSITLKDQNISVTNKKHIEEFLDKTDARVIKKISNLIYELDKTGHSRKVSFNCTCCDFEVYDDDYEFDPSHFFA